MMTSAVTERTVQQLKRITTKDIVVVEILRSLTRKH